MVVLVTVVNEVVVSAALVVSVAAPCFGDVDDVYHYHVKNKTISDGGITVDFSIIKVPTSN